MVDPRNETYQTLPSTATTLHRRDTRRGSLDGQGGGSGGSQGSRRASIKETIETVGLEQLEAEGKLVARVLINSTAIILVILQSLIVDLLLIQNVSGYGLTAIHVIVDIFVVALMTTQFSRVLPSGQICNTQMIYIANMAIKGARLNANSLIGPNSPPLQIPTFGDTLLSGSNALVLTALIYYLYGILEWIQNYDKDVYSKIPEASISSIVILKVAFDLFDISLLPHVTQDNVVLTAYPHLSSVITWMVFSGYMLHAFSGFGRSARFTSIDDRLTDEWIITTKHACVVSAIFVDSPLLIIRSLVIHSMWDTAGMTLNAPGLLVKNVLCLPLSLFLFHQVRLVELDEMRFTYNEYEKRGASFRKENARQFALRKPSLDLPDRSTSLESVHLDDEGSEYDDTETKKGRKNIREALIKGILDDCPGVNRKSLNRVIQQVSQLRRLPVKAVPRMLGFWEFFKATLLTASRSNLSSLMDADVSGRFIRRFALCLHVFIGLIQPLAITILATRHFDLDCYGGVAVCGHQNLTYWTKHPNNAIQQLKNFFCWADPMCITAYAYLASVTFLTFVLSWINAKFLTSFLQSVYFALQVYTFWLSLAAIRWMGLFHRTLTIPAMNISFNLEDLLIFLVAFPSTLAAGAMAVNLIAVFFGARYVRLYDLIRYRLRTYDYASCLLLNSDRIKWKKLDEAEQTYKPDPSDEGKEYALILVAVYYGLKYHVLAPAFNEVLISSDLVRSLRLMDSLHIYDWSSFFIRLFLRLCICASSGLWPQFMFMAIQWIIELGVILVSHAIRLLAFKRYEIKVTFEYAVEYRRNALLRERDRLELHDTLKLFESDGLILLSDAILQIRNAGFFSDHATIFPPGLF